jgi:uncharacterized repeat protein (TIGR01451 family)
MFCGNLRGVAAQIPTKQTPLIKREDHLTGLSIHLIQAGLSGVPMKSKYYAACILFVLAALIFGHGGYLAQASTLFIEDTSQSPPHGSFAYLAANAPQIDLSPLTLEFSLPVGFSGEQTLQVSNLGDLPLEWSLVEAPAVNAHPGQAGTVILYGQYEGELGLGQVSGVDLSSPEFSSQAADDFEVPEEEIWMIEYVDALGLYSDPNIPALSLNFFLYADQDGQPGAEIFSAAELPVTNEWGGTLRADLPEPVALESGRYWVSFQPVVSGGDQDSFWYWYGYKELNGSPYHWRQPGDGNQTGCLDWAPGTTCGGSTPDLAFLLLGKLDNPCDAAQDFAWLSAAPAQGTVAPGAAAPVSVAVDTSALEVGSYAARLCLFSNDPARPVVSAQVSLQVTENPYAVGLAAAAPNQSALPGQEALFNLLLSNQGSVGDTYDVLFDENTWPVRLSQSSAVLGAGESLSLQAWVEVPAAALAGESDSLRVRAVSRTASFITAEVSLQAAAGALYDAQITPALAEGGAQAEKMALYPLLVTNTGNIPNTYTFSAINPDQDPQEWVVELPSPISLGPGEAAQVSVGVRVPGAAPYGQVDEVDIRVSSLGAHPQTRQSRLRTQALGDTALLSLGLTAAPSSLQVGSLANLELAVENIGPVPVNSVVLECSLPSGVSFISAPDECSLDDQVVSCELGRLLAGEKRSLTIVVQAAAAGSQVNRAVLWAAESDQVQAEVSIQVSPRTLYLALLFKK